jgi:hypothetical protein
MKKYLQLRAIAPAMALVLVSLSFISFTSAALASSSDRKSEPLEICIRKPSEIARYPDVARAIAGFGGLDVLEGDWKLTGLITVVAKARVGLSHTSSGFVVEINRSYTKPFYICVNEARPDLITLKVQQAENPSFAKLVLKPGKPNESLYVAAAKTSGKFVKFKRPND